MGLSDNARCRSLPGKITVINGIMKYEEAQLSAALEQLKTFSATITGKDTLADLAVIIDGFETMRPYVRVGLKIAPSAETLEAMNRLREGGKLTQQLWVTLMNVIELGRKPNLVLPLQPAVAKPYRRVRPRSLGRSLGLGVKRMNRFA